MPQRMAGSIGKQFRGLCCRCPPKSHRLMIFDMHCCIVAFIRPRSKDSGGGPLKHYSSPLLGGVGSLHCLVFNVSTCF
jgi:hypothetical protein